MCFQPMECASLQNNARSHCLILKFSFEAQVTYISIKESSTSTNTLYYDIITEVKGVSMCVVCFYFYTFNNLTGNA